MLREETTRFSYLEFWEFSFNIKIKLDSYHDKKNTGAGIQNKKSNLPDGFILNSGTGSVSQKGEIQPIGGVNEKIEGFFDVYREKGLTGKQGVIIPEVNVKDLMLKTKLVEAVREGRFHVFPITHIEQGLEILTGKKAGKKKRDGAYPKNTINFRIKERLDKLNEISKEAAGKEKGNEWEL